ADLALDVRGLLLRELRVLVREEEGPGDVVVDPAGDGAPEPGAEDVFLHPHQDAGLRTGLLALEDVEVHLVAVEVSDIWGTVTGKNAVRKERVGFSGSADVVDLGDHSGLFRD